MGAKDLEADVEKDQKAQGGVEKNEADPEKDPT